MKPRQPDSCWRPTASLKVLEARAQLYRTIRQFFYERNVLEVETPLLGEAATVDPHIDSLGVNVLGQSRYLQTSPEFYLKRLLAAGSGDIYSLGKVFREGEKGRKHQPEFTMLEWYRVGWDEHQLMEEVKQLLAHFFPDLSYQKINYRELFLQYIDIDPHNVDVPTLKKIAQSKIDIEFESEHKDTWLDLLMTHIIEPHLSNGLTFIYDYPLSQAALAASGTNIQGQHVARRFEVYINGMELANGYFELTDAVEQKKRFEENCHYRVNNGLPNFPYDKKLVEALEAGLPACSGVALGVDRLLMLICQADSIENVISFSQ
jgi:lysyl-tRNA synthetase class 2